MSNIGNMHQNDQYDTLDSFVKESTKDFDESHGFDHAMNVYNNTMHIVQKLDIAERDWDILIFASKLHDVCDHKYKNSIPKQTLHDFIVKELGPTRGQHVIRIIENVSYSKQVAGHREHLEEPLQTYLDIVSDADRIEALGKTGIFRCETLVTCRKGKVPEDVIKHCHEKLLKLYPEHFIKTQPGREMAKPLHEEIVAYVKMHSL